MACLEAKCFNVTSFRPTAEVLRFASKHSCLSSDMPSKAPVSPNCQESLPLFFMFTITWRNHLCEKYIWNIWRNNWELGSDFWYLRPSPFRDICRGLLLMRLGVTHESQRDQSLMVKLSTCRSVCKNKALRAKSNKKIMLSHILENSPRNYDSQLSLLNCIINSVLLITN